MAGFVRQASHVLEPTTKLVWNRHLDAICQHLEAVTDGRITRLLANLPLARRLVQVDARFGHVAGRGMGPCGLASMR
ncbi:hypothetical protein [Mesorhizobium sp.]|uniref:hypothetical protein n=1 Tax=Mesorhizobium sp. TaxID=1871066 RepID=UPI0011F7032C|nr:hypothetical protein [Mesorhizobium sp.]TIT04406.1 MAG: hypothetical protein E5W87_00015 [Mesorhizobium sp.]